MTLATAPRDLERPQPGDRCRDAGHDWRRVQQGGFDEAQCRRCGVWSYELPEEELNDTDSETETE